MKVTSVVTLGTAFLAIVVALVSNLIMGFTPVAPLTIAALTFFVIGTVLALRRVHDEIVMLYVGASGLMAAVAVGALDSAVATGNHWAAFESLVVMGVIALVVSSTCMRRKIEEGIDHFGLWLLMMASTTLAAFVVRHVPGYIAGFELHDALLVIGGLGCLYWRSARAPVRQNKERATH